VVKRIQSSPAGEVRSASAQLIQISLASIIYMFNSCNDKF